MLVIRMRQQGSRDGRKFRIVAADKRAPRDGSYVENLGWYDPCAATGEDCALKLERIEYWKAQGAQMTASVQQLIDRVNLPREKLLKIAEVHTNYKKARRAKATKK